VPDGAALSARERELFADLDGRNRPSPTPIVLVPTTVEVPRVDTGAMARWSLLPVHATTPYIPGHDLCRDGHDRGAAAEGRRVVDVEGDEVPVVVAGPGRAVECTRACAVVPALPVAVRVVEPETRSSPRPGRSPCPGSRVPRLGPVSVPEPRYE